MQGQFWEATRPLVSSCAKRPSWSDCILHTTRSNSKSSGRFLFWRGLGSPQRLLTSVILNSLFIAHRQHLEQGHHCSFPRHHPHRNRVCVRLHNSFPEQGYWLGYSLQTHKHSNNLIANTKGLVLVVGFGHLQAMTHQLRRFRRRLSHEGFLSHRSIAPKGPSHITNV